LDAQNTPKKYNHGHNTGKTVNYDKRAQKTLNGAESGLALQLNSDETIPDLARKTLGKHHINLGIVKHSSIQFFKNRRPLMVQNNIKRTRTLRKV